MINRIALFVYPLALFLSVPLWQPFLAQTAPPPDVRMSELWEPPTDIGGRDLFNGPWGTIHAPDPHAVYTFIRPKHGGVNPGVVVRDPRGREWHVKQAPQRGSRGDEGPVEVTLSRVLSALGYHQPPVYFLPSFTMTDRSGTRVERGGRFRLHDTWLKDRGSWSWQQNPFVGAQPFNGLLVMLMMFNSTDLKNSNNTLYEIESAGGIDRRYVVRDLGAALGQTARLFIVRNDVDRFERSLFIRQTAGEFVEFHYRGAHQELVRGRITRADVGWAGALADRLSPRQWSDAFRAGGYSSDLAARFIVTLRARIAQAKQVGAVAVREAGGQ